MQRKEIFLFFLLLAFTLQPSLCELNSASIQIKKDQEELKHEVVVVLKLVQVYVTDKKGNPVTDLEKSDFILYDNGKLQTVTDFEKHLLVQPEKKVEEEIAKTELPPAGDVSSRMNRKFFLLLDIDRNSSVGISKSKKAALHFIDTQLQPTDEVGVFSYSFIRRLVLHQYLTSDHEKAREAIKRIKEVPGNLSAGGGVTVAKGRGPGATPFTQPSFQMSDVVDKTNVFIKIIKEFAKALRHIQGYKNIILFSRGIGSNFLFSPNQVLREKFEDMSKEFATSNSPVHTVSTALKSEGVSSLKMLSELSGGKYFPNVDYYEKIAEQIQNVTSNYYVLGYYIDEKWDGKYHEIKVKVKRKGCEVYAQGGFFNPKPFNEFSDVEKRLHLFDLAMSENPQFQVPCILPSVALPCSEKEESNLVMLSEIPIDKIKEVMKGESEVLVLIFDEDNNIADSHEGKINFYTLHQEKIYLYSISSLLPGSYECRLVLRDIKTGKGAVASSSVVIPEASDSGIKLFPPLLLIPEKKTLYLKLSHDQEKEIEKGSLSLNDIYPFLPENFSPVVEEVDRGINKLLAVLRLSIIDAQESEIEISAHLIDYSSNQKIPLHNTSIHAAEKREGIDVLLIEFQLPELEAGEYSLEIIVEEMTTQEKSQVSRTFRVK